MENDRATEKCTQKIEKKKRTGLDIPPDIKLFAAKRAIERSVWATSC